MRTGYTFLGQPTGTSAGTVAAGDHIHSTLAANSAPDHNYLAWTGEPAVYGAATTILASNGLMYVARIALREAKTISTISMYCVVQGATLTSGQNFAALYSGAGALLSQSVDQSTAWATIGLKAMTLAGPQAVPAGYVYVGLWGNGTTLPTFARASHQAAGLSNAGLAAPNLRFATADTGRTTTAPATIGTQTASLIQWWIALS